MLAVKLHTCHSAVSQILSALTSHVTLDAVTQVVAMMISITYL